MNGEEIGAILTIFAAMLVGFYAIATRMLNQATNDRDADRKERKQFSEAVKQMAKSSTRVAEATEKGASEAKQRNGHLAELVLQGNTATNEALKRLEGTTVIAAKGKDVLVSDGDKK